MRVVTWNIRAAIGPGPFPDRWWARIDADRLRAIGAFISTLDADVVALQEVAVVSRDGDLVDNAGDLARQLGMGFRYGAVRTFEVANGDAVIGVGCFGNALLSRLPIASSRTMALPQTPFDALVEPAGADHPLAGVRYADAPANLREPRCLLLAEAGGVTVGSVHLSHIGSGERRLQAAAVAAAVAAAPTSVLLGDFNAAIDRPELEDLRAWTDAFAAAGTLAGDPRRTTTEDGHAIDHVLVHGIDVLECQRLDQVGWLSDHLPVMAVLRPR